MKITITAPKWWQLWDIVYFDVLAPKLPLREGSTIPTQPIVGFETDAFGDPQSYDDEYGVAEENIQYDMIPPTFSEVWQDVLPG